MLRNSFRRSQRSQGFKVKHALQVFLLVSVSVWLLYQVRHSRDKSTYEEGARVAKETLKLGRKDLLPSMADAILPEVMIHKLDDQQHKTVDQSKPQEIETRTTVVDGAGEEMTKSKEKKEEQEHKTETGSEEKATHESNGEAEKDESEGKTDESVAGTQECCGDLDIPEMGENKDESEGKTDESVAGTQESCGDLDIPEMGENKAQDDFARWSDTNSTEAYIHQEERDTNMNIKDDETNNTLSSSSSSDSVESNNSTDSAADEGNSTVTETATCGENSSAIDEIGSLLANATLFSEATLLRTKSVKSNATEETGEDGDGDGDDVLPLNTSNNNTNTGKESSSGGGDGEKFREEGDYPSVISNGGNAGTDDVQKLKEEVDYSSVSRKEDDEKGFREDTEESSEDGSSVSRERGDSRTELETLPGKKGGGVAE